MEAHEMVMYVLFFVHEGQGYIVVEQDAIDAESGDLIEVEAGKMRAWENIGNETLSVLVIKLTESNILK